MTRYTIIRALSYRALVEKLEEIDGQVIDIRWFFGWTALVDSYPVLVMTQEDMDYEISYTPPYTTLSA
jgi:hypothetical protein